MSLELQLLSDIEEHLKCTITQCEPDIKVPVDEFDGKVSYGQRRALGGACLLVSTTHTGTVDFCNDEAKMKRLNRRDEHCCFGSLQGGTTRVTWMFWPRQSRNLQTWSEKPRVPSSIWDT